LKKEEQKEFKYNKTENANLLGLAFSEFLLPIGKMNLRCKYSNI